MKSKKSHSRKFWRSKKAAIRREPNISPSHNFADIETNICIIQNIFSAASKAAAAEAKAVGIPKVYAVHDKIILEKVDGTREILFSTEVDKPLFVTYNKNRVLHARAK